MTTRLLSLPVRRRRDWLVARHRARQVASLLGFDPDEQAALAAAAFEVCRRAGQIRLHFDLAADRLLIVPESVANGQSREPMVRLERALPARRPDLGTQDLPFIVNQLAQRTPLDMVTEIERQNLELLRLAAAVGAKAPAVLPEKAEINAA